MADGRRALLAVVLSVAVTTGCGVSETRRPVDLGDAAIAGSISGITRDPPSPNGAFTPTQLVTYYLQAAVGDPKDTPNRVRDFFVPKANWEPGPVLTVVRVIGEVSSTTLPGSKTEVSVRLQTVGTLKPDGSFEPGGDPKPSTAKFLVVTQGGPNQYRLEKAPNGLMISDTTLEQYYAPSPVYFWNSDPERPQLVPDLRYVPLNIALAGRVNQVVEWQLAGPSPWLQQAVSFQQGVKLKETVVLPRNGPVVVNLTSAAVSDKPEELRRLADQLRWTVRAHVSGPLELQIEGQKRAESVGDGYLDENPAAEARDAALFDIDAESGKVVSRSGLRPAPEVLESKANAKGIVYAGISARPYNVAAYVSRDRDRVTVARQNTGDRTVSGLPAPIGRPVWIPESNDRFLVPAAGKLYVFGAGGRARQITPTGIGGVAFVSVSPDGRRVALAAGGKAYVGALAVSKGSVKVGTQLRELVPERMSVAAVAWTSEAKVLVAGSAAGKAALFRATADGAIAVENSPGEAALIDVVAFPDRTGGISGASYIVARTRSAVFYVFIREAEASSTVQPAADLKEPFYAG